MRLLSSLFLFGVLLSGCGDDASGPCEKWGGTWSNTSDTLTISHDLVLGKCQASSSACGSVITFDGDISESGAVTVITEPAKSGCVVTGAYFCAFHLSGEHLGLVCSGPQSFSTSYTKSN